MSRLEVLRSECEAAGFTFGTYSPGDGVTRYRFLPLLGKGMSEDPIRCTNYFAANGDFTALGWKEARAYATGRVHGFNHAKEVAA
jgi:hypothetical protein